MGKTKTAFVGDTPTQSQKSKVKSQKSESEKVHLSGLKGGQRIKIVEAEPVVEQESEKVKEQEKKITKIKTRGKRYLGLKSKIDRNKLYKLDEAIKLIKETSYSKFDGTMELHLLVKKTGLSFNVNLPHSTGKQKKIEIADTETLKKLKEGKIDFDILLATSEMMPNLVPYARVLGPKGLMPNPKNGTLIKSEKEADKFKGNNISIRTEKEAPLIHTTFGKVSQKDNELEANAKAILDAIDPKQIVKAYMKSTMSPSVKLSPE